MPKLSGRLTYTGIYCTKSDVTVREICRFMRRFTSRSPMCDTMNFHRSAVKKSETLAIKTPISAFFSQRFDENSLHNKPETGGDSPPDFASFSYTSLFGTINTHILNCPDSFGIRVCSKKKGIYKGCIYHFPLLNCAIYRIVPQGNFGASLWTRRSEKNVGLLLRISDL